MKPLVALLRIAMGLLVLVAVVATFIDTASRTAINPFNFFGYFTLQSNILGALIFIGVGAIALSGRTVGTRLHAIRGMWVAYLAVVGIVYNTVLVGTPGGGGVALEWANHVVHIVFPIYAAVDWLLFADRPALAWRQVWLVLIYPIVWAIVVLIRGATDGWVPYPFLDPALGYGSVAIAVIAISLIVLVVGVVVWATSRLRIVRVAR